LGAEGWGLGIGAGGWDWGLGIGVQAQLTDYGRAGTYREGSGRRHVEEYMFDVTGLVYTLEALRECFDLVF